MKQPIKNQTQIILDSIADGVFTVDADLKITSFNRAAEKITGVKKEEAVGSHCWEVFRASVCESQCSLKQTMDTGKPIVNQSIFIVNRKGERISVSISTALLKDEDESIIGGVETFRDISVVEELRKELTDRHSFLDIISKNKEMQRLFGMLEQVSQRDTTILLEGESGTGKELFAKAIHSLSPRKDGPMITVNCGSLPDTLLESELFGYEAGAFTDAKKDKPGRFALAEGGTLFLDEIGDVSPAMQMRLLRFLQERVYEPLGSVKPVHADVRIVTATHQDLAALVEEKKFREDLYYRINIVKLQIPPLRDRIEDVPLLVEHFIDRFNTLQGREVMGVSDEALSCLMSYHYPGNVRELENIIERAFILCRSGHIEREHLPQPVCHQVPGGGPPADLDSFKQMEASFLMNALRRHNWNRTETAKALGIHKTTLFRKIKALGLQLQKGG